MYKQREVRPHLPLDHVTCNSTQVTARDSLDVYIEQRLMLQQQQQRPDSVPRNPRNMYPPELIRRL